VAWAKSSRRRRSLGSGRRRRRSAWRIASSGSNAGETAGSSTRCQSIASSSPRARSRRPASSDWAAASASLRHEPIVTVYARSAGCSLPEPLLALPSDAGRPAQFVFDRGRLGGEAGLLGFVISGASAWVERGAAATEQATLTQAREALARHLRGPLEVVRTMTEKRATFACTPQLVRPGMTASPGLLVCGDYIDGPYPATLEGAVRSGVAAARAASG
jgi:predicted NAD/FAD-dependent oxidoreductase